MIIGLGITTYNRPQHLKQCYDSALKFAPSNLMIHVEDDSINRMGIAYRKNECLRQLQNADYIFLVDDDIVFLKSGWAEFFIEASKISNQQHFCYLKETPTIKKINTHYGGSQAHLGSVHAADLFPQHLHINQYDNCAGCFMFLTKEVIEKVGAFGDYPAPYSFEHAGYSDRIHAAGLTPLGAYTCPAGVGDYIYSMDLDHYLPFNRQVKHEPSIVKDLHLLETYKKNNWHYYQMDRQTIYKPL